MNKTKLAVSIHVIAVIAAAGILIMATENVFAQSTSNPPSSTNSAGVDPQDQSTGPQDEQTTNSSVDNHNDGETNVDHNSASGGSNGDGEQKDSTESGK